MFTAIKDKTYIERINMKKLLYLLCLLLITTPCFAGGVGYINYEKVAAEYQFPKASMREIETKGREIENYLKAKEAEFNKLETPLQKQKFQEYSNKSPTIVGLLFILHHLSLFLLVLN